MKKQFSILGLGGLALLGLAGRAEAAQTLRVQVDQKGDFVLLGNTLGYECDPAANTPAPIVGTVPAAGACGTNTNDTSPDIYWRADDPADGQATASTAITAAQARSTAVLQIPAGASITHAYLYWGARGTQANTADTNVKLERVGAGAFTSSVDATQCYTLTFNRYHCVSDVAPLVKLNGEGAYRVSELNITPFVNTDDSRAVAGWWMVVFYQLATDPPRNLTLFDGFDDVSNGNPQTVNISGFLVPQAGFDAKLGVGVYEGDASLLGDNMYFYTGAVQGLPLTDAQNPLGNFFNGSRSYLGNPVTVVGDLPQLTGEPQSMAGIDIDVIDIKDRLKAGDTSATIRADSTQETYQLSMFVTSISTFKPDFSSSNKTADDVNGQTLKPGDEIEYTVVATNTGNDDSINTVMTDVLPTQVTYVPGSLSIAAGPNMGALTDIPIDDQGEYVDATRTVTVRLGTGANGLQGGTVPVGESTTVKFRVTLNADASGTISNQAVISAGGKQGAPEEDTPTDGNGAGNGQPPTDVVVGQVDPDDDKDKDGISDDDEVTLGTNPNDADTDDDGVLDGQEIKAGEDTDGDGLINALDPDSDNDGLFDGTEQGKDCSNPATDPVNKNCTPDADPSTTTDPLNRDTDGGGASDSSEDQNLNGLVDEGETDPTNGHGSDDTAASNVDTDGDGLSDKTEIAIGTNPNDADTDDDGTLDGQEANPTDDTDGDGKINALDPDSDNDGLFDGTEQGKPCMNPPSDPAAAVCIPDADPTTTTSPVIADTDKGGTKDGDEDTNHNGQLDGGETDPTTGHGSDDGGGMDSDGDGLTDGAEITLGTDPNDADTDDDGVIDGQEPQPSVDTDGDGLINALDPDSDNDGLFDGTELGFDCKNPATNVTNGFCTPDADGGATKTDPLNPDTDGGGVGDGAEDHNLNGAIDGGETDPTTGHGSDDNTSPNVDTDGDGLPDALEVTLGTDPNDADTDDDGALDGKEANPSADTDGDGLINALDVDSDNDGLFDGTELGFDCSNPATDSSKGHCIADGDNGATKTSPLDPDTDDGGVSDGSEDINRNGVVDGGETDPTAGHGADDATIKDSDNDGLSDDFETKIGTDPNDADSDNDGVLDGKEPNPTDDTDGDGKTNALDPDSDNDGLFDGTELGFDCSNPDTDASAGTCIPDGDKGATKTSPLDADTDDGGVKDGDEDKNHNGVLDAGETDPTAGHAADDHGRNDGFFAEGNGLLCSARPGSAEGSGLASLAALALASALAMKRRRRAAR